MQPDVALTLVIPLRAKAGMSLPDFYQYWLNAHVTLPPRFPGISSIWLHVVSFDQQRWPRQTIGQNRQIHGERTFSGAALLGHACAARHTARRGLPPSRPR